MNKPLPRNIDYVVSAPRRRSIADVPQRELTYRTVKLYIVGSLVWDYALTVLDISAQMRIGGPVKKLSRAVREIHKDYERIRSLDLDEKHIRQEWQLAEMFESINRENFKRLCAGLAAELRQSTSLGKEYEMLVEAVQMAMTVLDALKMFAANIIPKPRTAYSPTTSDGWPRCCPNTQATATTDIPRREKSPQNHY